MIDPIPSRPARRSAPRTLFAAVLALLFAWHATPAAMPAAASTPVVHVAASVPGGPALRDGAKVGPSTARLAAARSQAGPDGAPPPALPTILAHLRPPAPVARSGWRASDTPIQTRRTGDLYSARAPPLTA